jgi:integrase
VAQDAVLRGHRRSACRDIQSWVARALRVTAMEVAALGFVRARVRGDGQIRYAAMYVDVKGRQRSAGTFATEALATRAWQKAEDKLSEGRLGDARRGRQRFARYVEEQWLPHHQMEARTRENYSYYLRRHILPAFGMMRLVEIQAVDVREWVTDMKDAGLSPTVIRSCFAILSAIFTTAFNDQLTAQHPCRGVRTPPVPKKMRAIVTPSQFEQICTSLPNDGARLLVETDIETGLRWGELTELRPADIDVPSRVLTVSRVVLELVPKFHPDGDRFLIKQYPKDREHRRLKLNEQVLDALTAHITANRIGRKELLFRLGLLDQASATADAASEDLDLGLTEPNLDGRVYRHGTITAYSMAPCRCEHCRDAYALYRAARRAAGKDNPRTPRSAGDPAGHIPRSWFRHHIWQPTLTAADLPLAVRPHDLRHAHASWLLAGGADLQVVKERLGHGTITTTDQYLHTLGGADDAALSALRSIRRTPRQD